MKKERWFIAAERFRKTHPTCGHQLVGFYRGWLAGYRAAHRDAKKKGRKK